MRFNILLQNLSLFFIFSIFLSTSCQKRTFRSFDPCLDNKGNPKQCRPQFQNIALKQAVRVSETCGEAQRENFCRLLNRGGRIIRSCDVCESSGPLSHPASFLTDINDLGNITYWQSKSFQDRSKRDRITLMISFGKKFELSYISLQFFSPRPASMIIYKSMNNRRTWTPYQFYARNCQLRFGLPGRARANITNEQEALCYEGNSSPFPLSGGRVIFNPTKGRPSEGNFESSHVLQDWVTATDIKFVLTGVNDVNDVMPLLGFNRRRSAGPGGRSRSRKRFKSRLPTSSQADVSDDVATGSTTFAAHKGSRRSAPASGYGNQPTKIQRHEFGTTPFYAVNDVTIGGRCKCNGHASECFTKEDRLVCDCQHNTAGDNCERCKTFHFDRPWKRATSANANECVACNCNLHAKKCRFSAELYEKSGGVSGGVCQKCRHHTTGRYCHLCKPGYYKNSKLTSLAHRKICKTCGCHPVGAAGKICDAVTGQCPCKDGVAGKKCNRCAKGYEQTSSRIAPCIKIPVREESSQSPCKQCKAARSVNLSISKWCSFDYILEAEVAEVAVSGKWVRVTLKIYRVYKRGNSTLRHGLHDVRMRERHLRCLCLSLKKNRKYLLLGKFGSSDPEPQLVIDKYSVALHWRNKYRRKLYALVQRTRSIPGC